MRLMVVVGIEWVRMMGFEQPRVMGVAGVVGKRMSSKDLDQQWRMSHHALEI